MSSLWKRRRPLEPHGAKIVLKKSPGHRNTKLEILDISIYSSRSLHQTVSLQKATEKYRIF